MQPTPFENYLFLTLFESHIEYNLAAKNNMRVFLFLYPANRKLEFIAVYKAIYFFGHECKIACNPMPLCPYTYTPVLKPKSRLVLSVAEYDTPFRG